ncbi:MAG: AAA family ATPase [Planctomycetota bacterium]
MYEDWFQLAQRPFGSAPDGKVYYPANGIEAARSAMTRCISRGGGPGVVLGPAGVGKTTLALGLIDRFRAQVPVAYLSGQGIVSRRELFQTVLFELGRPYAHDEGELRLQLIDLLTSNDASRRRTLLVCDDADRLSDELLLEISAISNLATDGHWSVDVILLGTPALEEKLALPRLRPLSDRIASRFFLHPYDYEEVSNYLEFQLEKIGGCATRVFSKDAVGEVLETTGGIPRTINQLCDHALVLAMSHGVKNIDGEAIGHAWRDLQQLPPADRNELGETDEAFIEFGTLDDEPASNPPPSPSPTTASSINPSSVNLPSVSPARPGSLDAAPATATQAVHEISATSNLFPEETLDTIERQLAQIIEVDESPSSVESIPGMAQNPFLESFDEEEVVLDLPFGMGNRPGSLAPDANICSSVGAQVASAEHDLLEEVLRHMCELEQRSMRLSETLIATQQELETVRASAGDPPVMPNLHDVVAATQAGDQCVPDAAEIYSGYQIEIAMGPTPMGPTPSPELVAVTEPPVVVQPAVPGTEAQAAGSAGPRHEPATVDDFLYPGSPVVRVDVPQPAAPQAVELPNPVDAPAPVSDYPAASPLPADAARPLSSDAAGPPPAPASPPKKRFHRLFASLRHSAQR